MMYSVTTTTKGHHPAFPRFLASCSRSMRYRSELIITQAEEEHPNCPHADATRQVMGDRGRLLFLPSTRGQGRAHAADAATGFFLMTHVDCDNDYSDALFDRVYDYMMGHSYQLMFVVGRLDTNPSSNRILVWLPSAYRHLGGYSETQYVEDMELILKAFNSRIWLPVGRMLVDHVATDLKYRHPSAGANLDFHRRIPSYIRQAKKMKIQGFTLRQYLLYTWLTRRGIARFVAGATLGTYAYVSRKPLLIQPWDEDAPYWVGRGVRMGP